MRRTLFALIVLSIISAVLLPVRAGAGKSDHDVSGSARSNSEVAKKFGSGLSATNLLAADCWQPTLTVNDNGDAPDASPGNGACVTAAGVCTLRAAIEEANALSSCPVDIRFDGVTSPINLDSALPAIAHDLSLHGPGDSLLTVQRNPAASYFGVFTINSGKTVTISGLRIIFGVSAQGGAINNQGNLTVSSCRFAGNEASVSGGAIYSATRLAVSNTTFSNNFAWQGGAIRSEGTLTVDSSTFTNNTAINLDETVSLGGGIAVSGSGSVTNCTFAANASAAVYVAPNTTATLTNNTLEANFAAEGAGGVRVSNAGGANVMLVNNIIADNVGGNCAGPISGSSTHNLATDGTCSAGSTQVTFEQLGFAPLQDSPQYFPLKAGSVAIDAGINSGASNDQRGVARPVDGDGDGIAISDVGAYEYQPASPSPTPTPTPPPSPSPSPAQVFVGFTSPSFDVTEGCVPATIAVSLTNGQTGGTTPSSSTVTVDYAITGGTASQKSDYTYVAGTMVATNPVTNEKTIVGRLVFAPGETSQTIQLLINDDSYVEGAETVQFTLSNPQAATLGTPSTATLTINDNDHETFAPWNPIDDPQTFVCQQYHDFLHRQPDDAGLAFWTSQITQCGTDAACTDWMRHNVAMGFFLSIEYLQTGYFVDRLYEACLNRRPSFEEFVVDMHKVGFGIQVGAPGWQQQLDDRKQKFAEEFVERNEFLLRYPPSVPAQYFVDKMFEYAGVEPTADERQAALNAFGSGDNIGRATAMRKAMESASVFRAYYNRAFVQAEYFGYLRRDANDPPDGDWTGYNFWLQKMDAFSRSGEDVNIAGDAYERVKRGEMVRAFILSKEYRERFGRP